MRASGGPARVEVLVLSGADVRSGLSMAECVEVMKSVMSVVSRGGAELPLRTVLPIGGPRNRLGVMQGYLSEPPTMGVKVLCLYPDNPGIGYSSHMGMVMLFDAKHGLPLALINAAELTALRTAAMSAAATRVLARPEAADLAILGTGEQARNHLEAMALVRRLRRVRVWGRTPEHVAAFVQACAAKVSVPIEVASDVRSAVQNADIVCTTTASKEPILEGAWISPGCHVNLVGSSYADGSEVDDETIIQARVFVDYGPSAQAQAGELLRAVGCGRIGWRHVAGEIGEVFGGNVAGRQCDRQITLYKSLGVAAQDLAAGKALYEAALHKGIGTRVAF